jgi:hypothetical protein
VTPEVTRLIERLSELHVELAPGASQRTVAGWLEDNGFRVRWEVPVADRGDGRGGRVDLVGYRDGLTMAIEIDRAEPKPKSIVKLRQVPDAVRVVVIRGVDGRWTGNLPEGIDAVVSVPLVANHGAVVAGGLS